MLTYRGDIFVKGKKFKINESLYRFQKRDSKDKLVFESVDDKKIIKLTDSEFKKANRPALKEDTIDVLDPNKRPKDYSDLNKWREFKNSNPWDFKSNKPNNCPVCDADLGLIYGYNQTSKDMRAAGEFEYDDDGWFAIPWKCKKCGAEGNVIFQVSYWGQGVFTKDGMVEVSSCGIKPDW